MKISPLIDEERLQAYLDDRLPGNGPFTVKRHRAGHSNETFFIARDNQRWVLRRPPLGAFLPTAHDVSREFRVLSALGSATARTPGTVLLCADESVIGAPFYVMEFVDGVVMRSEVPDFLGQGDRARVGDELVDALAELHGVDYEKCGLTDFGKPDGYLGRQLRRWNGQLELTLPLTRPLPDLEKAGEWLGDNLPPSSAGTIVHGDYKLDNVVFASGAPARLLAILDWEMSTLGDPLADLGWMVAFWQPDAGGEGILRELGTVTLLEGFRPADELIDRYRERTGLSTDALDWYIVLAVWKLAILLEGSYARHLAGMTDDPLFARMEIIVPALARRALQVAGT